MNKLIQMNDMGFIITWKLINIGLYGFNNISVQLTRDEVIKYFDGVLIVDSCNDKKIDDIISLLCVCDDFSEVDKLLCVFANNEASDTLIQVRKWRAFLLKTLLDNISLDYLQGLLELIEFWREMGYPDECPMNLSINVESMSVQDYFTQSMYEDSLTVNYIWLEREISNIIELEQSAQSDEKH